MRFALVFCSTLALACSGAIAQTTSREAVLQTKIIQAEKKSDSLNEQGEALGSRMALGTMWNEVDVPRHLCASLGILLGQEAYTENIRTLASEPIVREGLDDSEIGEMLRLQALSYSNFALAARYALEQTEFERAMSWNLDCTGSFGIPLEAAITMSKRNATFSVSNNTLYILGDIEAGFGEEFARVIAAHPTVENVALSSAGGGLAEAIRAGYMIRTLKLDTTLSGNCFSACVFVFLGGVDRRIWSPYPDLGFHQASVDKMGISPGSVIYRELGDYVTSMGANPRFILAAMFAAKPETMFIADIDALCENRVATWVQRLC